MGKKILIVEDDVDLQGLYKKKLTDEGFEVAFTTTGESALNSVYDFEPDLVLLDIMLGGKMNGFDVLESIRGKDKFTDLPVIIFTNLDNQDETAKNVGATEYVVKVNTTPKMMVDLIKEKLG